MVQQYIHMDKPADVASALRCLPSAFPDALVALMKWRGVTVEVLAEKALTSTDTISRLRNDMDYTSSLELIIAICVALLLPPAIYSVLIKRAGHNFKATERHIIYQQLLAQAYFAGMDIHQFNRTLAEYGIPAIGKGE